MENLTVKIENGVATIVKLSDRVANVLVSSFTRTECETMIKAIEVLESKAGVDVMGNKVKLQPEHNCTIARKSLLNIAEMVIERQDKLNEKRAKNMLFEIENTALYTVLDSENKAQVSVTDISETVA